MGKKQMLMAALLGFAASVNAGGLMTNTNYHIAFDRMMARGASFDIDAAYSNPAGLAWGQEGLQLSLNFQKPWQNRDIQTTVPNYLAAPALGYAGVNVDQKYNGKASAPIVPALFASYKKDKWAVSAMIGIVGSGGFVKYDDGIPMFNMLVMAKLLDATKSLPAAAGGPMTPEKYTIDSKMEGKQYIYGGQLNFTYKITDFLAAAVGVRANYYDGYNRGHVTATTVEALGNQKLIDLQLDCLQKGWGFAPIVSVDFHEGPLNITARYEFRTKINTENDTKELYASIKNTDLATAAKLPYIEGDMALAQFGDKVAPYADGAKTRYDMPSLLSIALGYEFTDKLRATAEYHFFDDKHAKMAGNRQDYLAGGTNEYLLGLEYDINEKFTVSCGGQRTDYGLADDYQQNTSFACDSWSFGLGGAVNLTEKIRLNAGYFCTIYSDYTKEQPQYLGTPYAGKDVYSRTNHVIGIGVDYKF
jgi:long-chain fatty acid transport protein